MKTALVTGATGSIGAQISHMLARKGFSLFLHYNKNEEYALKLKNELEFSYNVTCLLVSADLSKPDGPLELLKKIPSVVDAFIYNCGSGHYGLLTDFTDESINETIQLNLLSAITISKSIIPGMVQKKAGKIVMISSVWGQVGASCETVYSAAKGGLDAFMKALAKEVAPSHIQVNSVAPGVIDTGMLDHFSETEKANLTEDIPAGRFGNPEEVAYAVEFLLSEKADYISGHILSVNGSWFT
ncbi:SDR family oxidoreductase [Fictibacillus nanhaiensis]|uniref:elongation factor P 5-aminopentanone reductase n=1 Tax=Fictibacillus nanhaiensis TaxID=742169 RepID=UPI001C985E89|nr:SDR family NAD(P)-dependent oxidoreductase [Fictibacillus nanhaiensis]MBY6036026.1 SDR family oxidoreductase [Fictibacillus nanhaiensis]